MGDEQRVPTDQLLQDARERFDEGTDFTVAVEEEFALLDPVSLDLVNRFEDVQAAAAGTEIERHLAGELIASEVEIKTGRLETFAAVPQAMVDRRLQLVEPRRAARSHAGGHRIAPLGELEGSADHRHAALPPQRPAPPLRRLEEQHLRLPRPRRDQGRRSRAQGHLGVAQLAPRAARPLGELAVRRGGRHGPPFGPHPDLHAVLPALRRPRRVRHLGGLRALRPVPLRHRLDRPSTPSCGGASGRTSRSPRSRSASATASPTSPSRRRSRRCASRSRPGSRVPSTRASRSCSSRTA